MRRVTLGTTGIETSCLGFGCASLGSRIAAADGLWALEAAFERGVTWIDLAPIYGGGAAEEIVAPFLSRHRDRVQVCTKVGLALPTAAGGSKTASLKAMVMPFARRVAAVVPSLRTALRRRGVGAAKSQPLTPELIRSSLEASLRRLRTDGVDLYALHDPDPTEIGREEVLRALEEVVASGKARAVAVAGDLPAAERALVLKAGQGCGAPFGVLQLPLPEPGAPVSLLDRTRAAGLGLVTHSVFGIGGALDQFESRLAGNSATRSEVLERTGAADPKAGLARLLLERAFALNPAGVVLASMMSARSLGENLRIARQGAGQGAVALANRLAA